MIQLTEFGKKIKIALVLKDASQNWLVEQVRAKTGLYFDDSYLHKILTGKSKSKKITEAICEILDIPLPPDCE